MKLSTDVHVEILSHDKLNIDEKKGFWNNAYDRVPLAAITSLVQQPLPLVYRKDSAHDRMSCLARGSVRGWCRIA